ncbi:ArgS-related anticodon-binding protein NrtL [Streptomyces sp. NPDC020412]|uniref:ArgS-related anticodon-binding protein NrtL n=1 Tax=Streptomyces sp. NPDC020412 TaxID=3365073 RepID=UPI0037B1B015
MTPAELSRTVLHAVRRAVEDGVLRVPVPQAVQVERPRPGGCGDYATNVALRLAGAAGQPPAAVARTLRERIAREPGVAGVEITGPGFLNITLDGGADRRRADVEDAVEQVRAHAAHAHGAGIDRGDRAAVWNDTVALLRRTQGLHPAAPVEVRNHPDTIDALGTDATRWAFLSTAAHDLPRPGEHLLRQHESNPLFTVRYAHARARALLRNAADLGFDPGTEDAAGYDDELERLVVDQSGVVASAARLRAPDRLARHLVSTADALLVSQHSVLPRGGEKPTAAHRSRLALAEAAGTVLAGGLTLLGISAPDHL